MIYLHRDELDEILADINEVIEADKEQGAGDLIEAHGLCAPAVAGVAMDCAAQATSIVEEDPEGSYPEAIADAYVAGVMLGLLAAERIGR